MSTGPSLARQGHRVPIDFRGLLNADNIARSSPEVRCRALPHDVGTSSKASRPPAVSRTLFAVSALLVMGGCFPRFSTPPIPPPSAAILREIANVASHSPARVALRVMVDSSREAVIALAGPFRLAPAIANEEAHTTHHGMDATGHLVGRLRFDWPVAGWVRGYELDLFDSHGRRTSPSFVHHFTVTNFDRRQLIYATAEKLVGVGRETGSVDLPVSLGVPLAVGQQIGMMVALHNEREVATEIFLRLVLRWTPPNGRRSPTAVMPLNLDVNNLPGMSSAYDLPAGTSSRAFEFSVPLDGRLLAISGHLHDYGLAVRLEDAETEDTVAEVRGVLGPRGTIVGVEQKKWIGLFGRGIRLRAGRRYRLVGEYDNPHGPIRSGAMTQMIAVFAPDDWTAWPRLDRADRDYETDAASWRLDLTSEEFMQSGAGAPAWGGQ